VFNCTVLETNWAIDIIFKKTVFWNSLYAHNYSDAWLPGNVVVKWRTRVAAVMVLGMMVVVEVECVTVRPKQVITFVTNSRTWSNWKLWSVSVTESKCMLSYWYSHTSKIKKMLFSCRRSCHVSAWIKKNPNTGRLFLHKNHTNTDRIYIIKNIILFCVENKEKRQCLGRHYNTYYTWGYDVEMSMCLDAHVVHFILNAVNTEQLMYTHNYLWPMLNVIFHIFALYSFKKM
jgi:hypothetical protein